MIFMVLVNNFLSDHRMQGGHIDWLAAVKENKLEVVRQLILGKADVDLPYEVFSKFYTLDNYPIHLYSIFGYTG